jgi:hypothetical protein
MAGDLAVTDAGQVKRLSGRVDRSSGKAHDVTTGVDGSDPDNHRQQMFYTRTLHGPWLSG